MVLSMYAALLTMMSSMFVAILGNSWYQFRENTRAREENVKTRELMVRLNHDTREELRAENKSFADELRAENKSFADELRAEHKSLGDELRAEHKSLGDELRGGLAAVLERLARIEGHLGIGVALPRRPAGDA